VRDIDALSGQVDALVGQAEVDSDVGVAVLKGEDQPADVQDPQVAVQEIRIVPAGTPHASSPAYSTSRRIWTLS